MKDFNLKKYLANNPLLKEGMITEGDFEEAKKYQKMLRDAQDFFQKKAEELGVEDEYFDSGFVKATNDVIDAVFKAMPDDLNEDRFEDVEHIFSGEDDPKLIQYREERDDLLTDAEVGIDDLLTLLKTQAYELGGDTNGPAIWYDIKNLIKDKL